MIKWRKVNLYKGRRAVAREVGRKPEECVVTRAGSRKRFKEGTINCVQGPEEIKWRTEKCLLTLVIVIH